jgi:hypothetical protein
LISPVNIDLKILKSRWTTTGPAKRDARCFPIYALC